MTIRLFHFFAANYRAEYSYNSLRVVRRYNMRCVAAKAGPECSSSARLTKAAAAAVSKRSYSGRGIQQPSQHANDLQIQVLGACASLLLCSSANATVQDSFAVKCAGCHINGGNIVQSGATLFTADLVKNNIADNESLYRLIYEGKGRMPGFGQECAPKGKCTFGQRLTDDEVREMAQYVLDKAAQDWKQ